MAKKERYTIIYQEYVGNGFYIQNLDRIKTDDLEQAMDTYNCVLFCFLGWPRMEGEGGRLKAGKDGYDY